MSPPPHALAKGGGDSAHLHPTVTPARREGKPMNDRPNVYEQAAAEAAKFDLPTDSQLRAKAARVRVRAASAGAAVLTALLDGLDRDIFAETVRDLGLGHQPRDHAVPCVVCRLETWHPHGTCPKHTDTCEQCCVPGSLEVTR